MAATSDGDIYLVVIDGAIQGQRTITTFYYRIGTVVPGATVSLAYDAIIAEWVEPGRMQALYKGCTPSNWTYQATRVQKIWPQRIRALRSTTGTGPGIRPPSELSNVAASITRFAEGATRRDRGGIRVPITPADVTGGMIAGTLPVALEALAEEMLAGLDGSLTAGIFSPVLFAKLPPPAVGVVVSPLFGTEVEFTSRVIRRRTVGLGI